MADPIVSKANAIADAYQQKSDADTCPTCGQSKLTPEYKEANKQDIEKTMPYNPDADFNTKIRNFFGAK